MTYVREDYWIASEAAGVCMYNVLYMYIHSKWTAFYMYHTYQKKRKEKNGFFFFCIKTFVRTATLLINYRVNI